MGLLSFVKNAGKSLFGAAEAAASTADALKEEIENWALMPKVWTSAWMATLLKWTATQPARK